MNEEYVLTIWGYDLNREDQRLINVMQNYSNGWGTEEIRKMLYSEKYGGTRIAQLPKELADAIKSDIEKLGYSARVEKRGRESRTLLDVRGYEFCRSITDFERQQEVATKNEKLYKVVEDYMGKEAVDQLTKEPSVRFSFNNPGDALELKKRIEGISSEYVLTIHELPCKVDYSTLEPSGKTLDIQNVADLKNYLKDLYTLEKENYSALNAKANISEKIFQAGQKHSPSKPQYNDKGAVNFLSGIFVYALSLAIGAVVGFFALGIITNGNTGARIGAIIGAVIGFIICKVVVLGDVDNHDKEEDARYERESREFEVQRKEELQRLPEYEKAETYINSSLYSCREALDELYGYDIIFPKYRNLLAISQIYEYFASGRVTELEGPNGAYNLFESELRQNIIIYELNTVINKLDDIRNYQRMTYDAIMESNRLLANIEQNTAVSAFNSSVIAENTNIMRRYADVAIHNN